jgi:hypothetical protein
MLWIWTTNVDKTTFTIEQVKNMDKLASVDKNILEYKIKITCSLTYIIQTDRIYNQNYAAVRRT